MGMHNVIPLADTVQRENGHIIKIHLDGQCAFIRPDCGGEDVYVTLIEFYQNIIIPPEVGMKVRFRRYRHFKNGRYRATDLIVGEKPSAVPKKASSDHQLQIISSAKSGCWQDGVIKWYNPKDGFGFVTLDDSGRDARVTKETLKKWGFGTSARMENYPVQVEVGRGKNTDELTVKKISRR